MKAPNFKAPTPLPGLENHSLPVLVARVSFEVKIFYFYLFSLRKILLYLGLLFLLLSVFEICFPASFNALFGVKFDLVMFFFILYFPHWLLMFFSGDNANKFNLIPKGLYWYGNHFIIKGKGFDSVWQGYINDEYLIVEGKNLIIPRFFSLRICDNVLIDERSLNKMVELNWKWHQDKI
jgi:hypothetical protein